MKPFVPSTEQRGAAAKRRSKGRDSGAAAYGGSKSELGESMMRRGRKDDFAFLTDDAEVREWEAN